MAFIKKLLLITVLGSAAAAAGFSHWAKTPVFAEGPAVEFTVEPGSSVAMAGQSMIAGGANISPTLFSLLARLTQKSGKIKAGSYDLKPGTTPLRLLDQLVRGEFAQESLTIIEGWTFRQMRAAIAAHPGLKHDTSELPDDMLLARISDDYKHPEGLFFPDTYLFAKGASDLQIYKQSYALLKRQLDEAWAKRDASLPYKTPYQALIMASIVEKETGQKSERSRIAGVFVNRLRNGMLLQTDPTVIYGMGTKYAGKIRKRDLETDTPYNTYTRAGLPPTPIALPGRESLAAALGPEKTMALYFVSRGDGTSHFSDNLPDHNRAVNKYQR
ncbi:endolytic transglycosylase MltG [Massilia glaciei]|uniref:Endolytic murein transglycosylase n=1 Tax=Massilia glaciei TaxID=1524097 RepID=A0A2U2HG82_9BURK|nr:endolytic transglycosylase MltG [Massilia glaciei]PWF43939.1 endolytic transglycosylase MltG [Massilia glaciei]